MNRFLFILLVLQYVLLGCSSSKDNSQVIEGDLYYSAFRIGSFYKLPDSVVTAFENSIDTLRVIDPSTQKIKDLFQQLKLEKRLYAPNIDLHINDSTIYTLYLDSLNYQSFKNIKSDSLIRNHLVLKIKAEAKHLTDRFYLLTGKISTTYEKGATLNEGGKFDVDYH